MRCSGGGDTANNQHDDHKACDICLSIELPYQEMERLGSWLPYAIWLRSMLPELAFFGTYWETLQHLSLIWVLAVTVCINDYSRRWGRPVALRLFEKF